MLTVSLMPKQKQKSLQNRDGSEIDNNKESFLRLFIVIYESRKNKDSLKNDILWMPFNALILFITVSLHSWKSYHPSQILVLFGNAAYNGRVTSNLFYMCTFKSLLQCSCISKSTNISCLMESLIH